MTGSTELDGPDDVPLLSLGSLPRRAAGLALALAAVVACAAEGDPPAMREPVAGGRLRALSIQLDNDSLATWPHDDRWYTAGFSARWLREAGDGWAARVADEWCGIARCGTGARAWRLASIEQRIWNPRDSDRVVPSPLDRPYGAWLAVGAGVVIREPARMLRLDARIGTTGSAALGEPVQNGVHRLLGLRETRGWDSQLRPRAGLQVGMAGLRTHGTGRAGVDWVHRVGAELGTLQTYLHAGAMLRFGRPPEGPTWPGEPQVPRVDGDAAAGRWHVFVGVDGRWIARDEAIEGPTRGAAPRVRAEPFGGDLFAGAALRIADEWWIELVTTLRAVEFEPAEPVELRRHRFGTLLLRWTPS